MTAQTAITADDLGEAVGKIAAFAALSLHESFPHLSLDSLVETFTRDSATTMIAARFLAALDDGKPPGEAAGAVGADLIRAWADARNEARAQLDQQTATPDPVTGCPGPSRAHCAYCGSHSTRPDQLLPRGDTYCCGVPVCRGDRGDCVADLDGYEKSFTA
ncbi:hypothetical protein OG235_36805 [Streptomyces sp. NBC_00024]|uniref:hypothetical protein n=1 Tax=Streptomyces sp. NBC_00024 TaxID=2903612 RepID=UPI00324883EA